MTTETEAKSKEKRGPFFTFFVDGEEFQIGEETITGAEIMNLAGIPVEVGLLLCLEDGTQENVQPDQVIELKPGRRFRKAPQFKRGAK